MRVAMRAKRCAWLAVVNGTHAFKRLLDVLISIIALLIAAPLMTVIALLVRRDGGPAFFKQRRIGFNGRNFEMLKFRSVYVNAKSEVNPAFAQDDPRITPIGHIIRKASIDELPQFFNVLRGDMSILGPHPCLPQEAALASSADHRRLHAKPGLTCLWQIGERESRLWENGGHDSTGFDEHFSLDERSIRNHSLRRDLWLLLKTIPAIMLGKGT